MIKISGIALSISYDESALKRKVAEKLGTTVQNIEKVKLLKKSLDARKKDNLKYNLTVAVKLNDDRAVKISQYESYENETSRLCDLKLEKIGKGEKVGIVGFGPAGMFAALTLLERGFCPVIFERGSCVEKRTKDVENLKNFGVLNVNSNIQFGEGGAGTFSDGKLNTGTKSDYIKVVLGEFVQNGAPSEIEFLNKPHIGTDELKKVVKNIRQKVIDGGGQILFDTKVDELMIESGKLKSIKFSGANVGEMELQKLILAIGHSSRDTFELLRACGVHMEQKAFSMGVRIEHKQSMINKSQYGVESSPYLPSADYKLATHLPNGRGVYTFCMCPGGEVVAAASEEGEIVTNGMSYHARNGENANSALLVSVDPSDFGSDDVLAGVALQRKYEKACFNYSNSFSAPIQLLGDLQQNKISKGFMEVTPTYLPKPTFANLNELLPKFITDSIVLGAKEFDKKIKGFASFGAVLTAVESRSSSPIRILRDENNMSNIVGIYPCGEGAGYAGGITSAAVDGIKTAILV